MIGMQRDPGGYAGRDQGGDEIAGDARGLHDRHAAVPAHDFHVAGGGEALRDLLDAARREDEGEQLERELGKSARFISTDVSNAKQVKAMVDCAINSFGRVDCLVNNAGSPSPMVSIVDVDMENY